MRVNPFERFIPVNAGSEAERLRGNRDQREPRPRSPLQLEGLLQAAIAVFTLTGLYLYSDDDPSMRFLGACVSLAAQPFWLIDAWRSRKGGVLLVALAFTVLWIRAIYIGW